MAKRHMEIFSTSLSEKCKSKAQYHFTLVRMDIVKKTSVGEDVNKKGSSHTVGGNVSYYGEQYGGSSKI